MPEIAFDKAHRFAVVTYAFWCGSLWGHGRTLCSRTLMVNGEMRM